MIAIEKTVTHSSQEEEVCHTIEDHVREAAKSVRRLRERGSMDKSFYRGFCEMGWEVKISRLKTG